MSNARFALTKHDMGIRELKSFCRANRQSHSSRSVHRRQLREAQMSKYDMFPCSRGIICGECGSTYGAKVWHSTDKYRRTVWQCNHKFKGDHRCTTPHLYESEIKELFLKAFCKLMDIREAIVDDCRLVQSTLGDQTELDTQAKAVTENMEITAELIRRCVDENTSKIQNQAEYFERYECHTTRYEKLKRQLEVIETERQRCKEKFDLIGSFITTLEKHGSTPIEFDDDLWVAIIDHVTINADESVVFTFKGGMEVTEQLQ